MKTIEEKAYDEALEKATALYKVAEPMSGCNVLLGTIFPELKESGDERIRNFISNELACLRATDGKGSDRYKELTNAIAWLEKQGNKSVNIDIESIVSLYKQRLKSQGVIENSPLVSMCLTSFRRGVEIVLEKLNLKKLKKQGESDKVKPKFKVGDWVVIDGEVLHVREVTEDGYLTDEGWLIPFRSEKEAHIWTIDDAKDGDVLAYVTDEEDLWIMIYWSLYEPYEGHIHYHALLVNDKFFDKGTCCICIDNLKPATKEQRDLLFQKMYEADYEWDDEKKELKIIDWSKHIKCEPNGPSIIKEKTTWSEEDERKIEELISLCKGRKKLCTPEVDAYSRMDELQNWLKSLKDRV